MTKRGGTQAIWSYVRSQTGCILIFAPERCIMNIMKQLEMRRVGGKKLPFSLPDGYTFVTYSRPEEKREYYFMHYKKYASDAETNAFFDTTLTNYRDCDPFRDTFFLKQGEEYVGTVTAVVHPSDNSGYVHMVCIREDYRGKGLAAAINALAVNTLLNKKVDYILLTTDDYRIPAIKSYLKAGFLPVMNERFAFYKWKMFRRWKKIYRHLGRSEFRYLTLEMEEKTKVF